MTNNSPNFAEKSKSSLHSFPLWSCQKQAFSILKTFFYCWDASPWLYATMIVAFNDELFELDKNLSDLGLQVAAFDDEYLSD
jgi:hypothetical protein